MRATHLRCRYTSGQQLDEVSRLDDDVGVICLACGLDSHGALHLWLPVRVVLRSATHRFKEPATGRPWPQVRKRAVFADMVLVAIAWPQTMHATRCARCHKDALRKASCLCIEQASCRQGRERTQPADVALCPVSLYPAHQVELAGDAMLLQPPRDGWPHLSQVFFCKRMRTIASDAACGQRLAGCCVVA